MNGGGLFPPCFDVFISEKIRGTPNSLFNIWYLKLKYRKGIDYKIIFST